MTAPLLKYFHNCYQADLRAVQVIHFLAKKVSFPHFEGDSVWASDTWRRHPVPTAWGAVVHKHLLIHGKEQQLYAGAFMLVGRIKQLGKIREVCAPLYLVPAQIDQSNDVFMVELDYSGMVINPAFAEALGQDEAAAAGLYEQLQQLLPARSLGFDEQNAIENAIKTLHLPIVAQDLYDFPLTSDAQQLGAQVQAQQSGFSLLPILGLGVVEKPSGSLGVLNELKQLAESASCSSAIRYLFNEGLQNNKPRKPQEVLLPATLSESQRAILRSSERETLTVVNGPPGTGKSFTIAAIAAHQLSIGGSVLIAAKNIQAVEVIADKLERDFRLKGVPVRASQADYRGHLRKRLRAWLQGSDLNRDPYKLKKLQSEMAVIDSNIKQLSKKIAQLMEDECLLGAWLLQNDLTLLDRLKKWAIELKIKRQRPIWQLIDELEQQQQASRNKGSLLLTAIFYDRLNHALQWQRQHLQKLLEALKTSSGNEKERYFQGIKFSKVLQAMPIWLVNSVHVHAVLPLEKELFDLVIIDEASQSDIASALPLLQRAKRAVIVGDPKQLRHLSFLSTEQQNKFLQYFGLEALMSKKRYSFRDASILDLAFDSALSQTQVHILDEHFRSLPGIIGFSNQRFYDDGLKIMTATPQNLEEACVFVHSIRGKRTASGQNTAEVEHITEQVVALIETEAKIGIDDHLCQSVGILSPFRAQVDLLKKTIAARCTAEAMLRHRILIGSPFDFQGEERDIMFISYVLDATSAPGAFTFLNREDVFNVSITRARSRQHLYVSAHAYDMPTGNLLRSYMEFLAKRSTPLLHGKAPLDAFMSEVITFLKRRGVGHLMSHYPIAGMDIDLIVVHQGKTYCIDLVGHPGTYQKAMPLARWNMLERVGLRGFMLPYRLWHSDRAGCEAALDMFLGL